MSLERTLAEIQVRAKEIAHRSIEGHKQGLQVNWSRVNNYTDGIVHEAVIAYDSFKAAKGKKDASVVNRHLGEFALGLKNMADNLNGLLQTFYNPSEKRVSHKEIGNIYGKAPKLDGNRDMLDLFLQTHDHVNGDVVRMRNRRSHGSGHDLVDVSDEGLHVTSNMMCFTVEQWMQDRIQSYLGMTQKVLNTIAEKEEYQLSDRKNYDKQSITAQRVRNWRKRHQKPIAIGLGSALVAGGVVGTLFFQEITEKQRQLRMGNEIRLLINSAQMANTENWALRLDSDKFNQTIDAIYSRNEGLGVRCDNFMFTLNSLSHGNINPDLKREYDDFANRRREFYSDLKNTRNRIKNGDYNNQIDVIYTISDILYREIEINKVEEKLNDKLGWSPRVLRSH